MSARNISIDSEWITSIVDGFAHSIHAESDHAFLSALDLGIQQMMRIGGDVSVWQNACSCLRRTALPYLDCDNTGASARNHAENLWQQARVMIAEATKRTQKSHLIQVSRQTATLREIGGKLINTFDVTALMDVLADNLPNLGILHCYLSVYEDPHPHTYLQPAPEWSRVLLSYNAQGRIALEPTGRRFLSRDLVPGDVVALDEQYNLVAEPLYFHENQLGFVVFGANPQGVNAYDSVYEALQKEISSALQGALLVQQVQEHAHELAAAYEEIRILNSQLQEENLRMGAELDVAHRLQTMVLPPPEELQQISGLDIAGYMQPADEVGGDYYDVLKKDGLIHIGIGDVTGHGLESGVLMLMTQTAIRTLIEHGETDPVAFVNTLNRTIYKNALRMKADKTLTFALIDYKDGQLKIVGQHEELLVVRRSGQIERVDTVDLGFPIGLEEHIAQWVTSHTITLQPGDGIVLYTDGIPEAANPQDELYGMERLCDVISRHWQHPAQAIQKAVVDDVIRFIGAQKVYDDITLVVLKQK
jgi:serine phosphatase RsbU (regulator of sigma subunit)